MRPPSQKDEDFAPVPCLCSEALVWELTKNHLSNCHSLLGPKNTSSIDKSQVIKGHPLGSSSENQGTTHT